MWGGQRTSKILTPPWSLVRPQILASSNATSQVKDSQHIRLESRIFSERCDKFAQVATSEVSVRSTRTKMFPAKCHKINRMKLLQKVSLSFPSFEWVSIYQCHSEASTEFQFMPWSIDSVIDLDYQKSEKKLANTSAPNASKNTLLGFPQIETQHSLGYSINFNCWGDATERSINFNKRNLLLQHRRTLERGLGLKSISVCLDITWMKAKKPQLRFQQIEIQKGLLTGNHKAKWREWMQSHCKCANSLNININT